MIDHTADPLVAELAGHIDRTLADVLRPGRHVALLNFPNHGNPGDPAIWLGERAALRRVHVPVAYQAAWSSYDPAVLQRVLPEGPILLNGGGNLGDLHPGQQQVRERVLAEFPDRRIVQLPQSIAYREPRNAERMRQLCEHHRDLVLLLRDQPSLDTARSLFDADVRLCPDMTFALGPLERPTDPDVDVLWLARRDAESARPRPPARPGVRVTDWWPVPSSTPGEPLIGLVELTNRLTLAAMSHPGRGRSRLWPVLARTFEPLARHWVSRGLAILAQGRVVVTDRLHGHVLALLMGIPNVVLDNDTGKLRAMVETFTGASPLTHWADDEATALDIARELAAG